MLVPPRYPYDPAPSYGGSRKLSRAPSARGARMYVPGASTSGFTASESVGPRLLSAAGKSGSPDMRSSAHGGFGKFFLLYAPHVISMSLRSVVLAPTVSAFLELAGEPTVWKPTQPSGATPELPAAITTSTSGLAHTNSSSARLPKS
jgi:hypothetical protein